MNNKFLFLFLFALGCATTSSRDGNSFLIDGELLVINDSLRGPSSKEIAKSKDPKKNLFEDKTVEMNLQIEKIHGRDIISSDYNSSLDRKCRLHLFSYFDDSFEKQMYGAHLDLEYVLKKPSGLDRFKGRRFVSSHHPRKIKKKNPWPPSWFSKKAGSAEDPRTDFKTSSEHVSYITANKENPFELTKYTVFMDRERNNVQAIEMEVRNGPQNSTFETMSIDTKARCAGNALISYHSLEEQNLLLLAKGNRSLASDTTTDGKRIRELLKQKFPQEKFIPRTFEMKPHVDRIHGRAKRVSDEDPNKKTFCRLKTYKGTWGPRKTPTYSFKAEFETGLKDQKYSQAVRHWRFGLSQYPYIHANSKPWPHSFPTYMGWGKNIPNDDQRSFLKYSKGQAEIIRPLKKDSNTLVRFLVDIDDHLNSVTKVLIEFRKGSKDQPFHKLDVDYRMTCKPTMM